MVIVNHDIPIAVAANCTSMPTPRLKDARGAKKTRLADAASNTLDFEGLAHTDSPEGVVGSLAKLLGVTRIIVDTRVRVQGF